MMDDARDTATQHFERPLTDADEIGLAESRSRQSEDSQPDTLEVRGDAWPLLEEELATLRRPALLVAGAVTVGLLIVVVGGLLSRIGRQADTA
jgi:hypothetical protein